MNSVSRHTPKAHIAVRDERGAPPIVAAPLLALEGLGRPVVYYPSLNALTGGTNATILLCALVRWAGQQQDPDGWLYKTQDEIEAETGLSRREQETARKQLRTAGMLEESRRGIPSRLWYRVDRDALVDAWGRRSAGIDGGEARPVGEGARV